MMPPRQFVSTMLLLSLAMPLQAACGDDIQLQLDELRLRLEAVQADTDDMREQVDALRAEATRDWITQQRSDELRQLVRDMLVDADTRHNLAGDGLLGGWSDGFFLASADGRFKLEFGGLLQERFMFSRLRPGNIGDEDEWRYGFENTRMRLDLSGWLFDRDLTFLVQPGYGWLDPDAVSSSPVLRLGARMWDAWIRYRASDQVSWRAGVFMLPFTRESLVVDERQLTVERSLIDHRLGLSRSSGVEVTWLGEGIRAFGAISNGSGVLRGADAASINPTPPWGAMLPDTDWSITGRVELLLEGDWGQFTQFTSPMGSDRAVMLGVAVHGQHSERDGNPGQVSNIKVDQWGITADLSIQLDGASFMASGTWHHQKSLATSIPTVDWIGVVLQGSTYVSSDTEVFLRWEAGGAKQSSMGGANVNILTAGTNWYLEDHGLKITTDFGWSFGKISDSMRNTMVGWRDDANWNGQWVLRTQMQLAF